MKTLFKVNINWTVFITVIFIIRIAFPELTWYSYFAIIIFLHQLFLLFFSFNHAVPIRYLFGFLMCLQMFIGPIFAYNGLDRYVLPIYNMKIPEERYFAYVIPAVICFIFGLHIKSGKLKGEVIDEKEIMTFAQKNPNLAYVFIGIGFISSFLSILVPSNLTTTEEVGSRGGAGWLFFVFFLLGNLKYIGAFILILQRRGMKFLPTILVYSSIIGSSLATGLFHDLLAWLIMLAAVMAIRFKPAPYIKAIFALTFILLAFIIQLVKTNYRIAIYSKTEDSGLSTFTRALEKSEASNDVFHIKNLALFNIRINQGFIITNIMKTVPDKIPYARGEELGKILEAAFLPRILAPDKLEAGDQKIFNRYTGLGLRKGTSMGLSSVGDAYINFGILGGCIFMLLLGLLYNWILKVFYTYSKILPFLILFTPLVFYYPIRPDCELQTILGHLVKSCFIVFIIFFIWKRRFYKRPSSQLMTLETVAI